MSSSLGTHKGLVRLGVFALLAVHMQAGPLMEQVLGLEPPPFGMSWTMYSGRGNHNCAVQWLAATPEGLQPLDRRKALEKGRKAGARVRPQRSLREIEAAAQELCRKLPGVDVRAQARCGVKRGQAWEYVLDPETPLCASTAGGR